MIHDRYLPLKSEIGLFRKVRREIINVIKYANYPRIHSKGEPLDLSFGIYAGLPTRASRWKCNIYTDFHAINNQKRWDGKTILDIRFWELPKVAPEMIEFHEQHKIYVYPSSDETYSMIFEELILNESYENTPEEI